MGSFKTIKISYRCIKLVRKRGFEHSSSGSFIIYTGLTKEENSTHLSDVILMRIAQRVGTEHLHPMTAGLLETVKYLDDVRANFSDLEQADHAYLVMAEWRKRTRNKKTDRDTTAEKMVKILKEGNIYHHLVCLVCRTL